MNNNRNKINGNFSFIKNNGKSNGKENKIIGIVSAKGGVGKTTTTINLGAAALSTFNKSVLLLDTNLDTGNLALHLGLSSHPTSIEQITRDSLSILDSIHKHKSGLHVVPSPFIAEDKKVDAVALKKKLKALKNYDLILLDSAPGIKGDAKIAVRAADLLLLVLTPDFPSIVTAAKTINLARESGTPIHGIILNRTKNKKHEITKGYIETTLGIPVIATIPEDSSIQEAVSKRMPVVLYKKNSKAAISYKKLSAYILGKKLVRKPFLMRVKDFFSGK